MQIFVAIQLTKNLIDYDSKCVFFFLQVKPLETLPTKAQMIARLRSPPTLTSDVIHASLIYNVTLCCRYKVAITCAAAASIVQLVSVDVRC